METSALFERLKKEGALSPPLRDEIVRVFGEKGRKALEALDSGRVMRYRDFDVVLGSSGIHVVEGDFCTCHDHLYRKVTCWHILAVRIAAATGGFRDVDEWYHEAWTRKQ